MGLSCFSEGTGTSAGHLCDLFEYRTLSRRSGQRPSRWLRARDYQHADVFHQRPPLGGGSTLCRVSSCHRQSSQTTTPFIVLLFLLVRSQPPVLLCPWRPTYG